VIERVAPEIGGTPNIVKYRTLADAGKHVFDIVAKYVGVWSGGTGKPLFPDPDDGGVIYTIAQGFGALSHALASQHNGGGESVIGAGAAVAPTPLPGSSDISLEDQNELMRQAGNVIAVMGIQDEQVDQYSQPAETQYAPSVPSLAPLSGAPSSNGNAGLDQLRQMVSQGQVPTADQLKALILPATS
jgi:hypothetical protein